MAAPISTSLQFPTKNQIPDHSIMDYYNKQAYLGQQYVAGPDTLSLASSSETVILLLQNPTSSGKSLFVKNLNLNAQGTADVITYRIYYNPTFSAKGTALTPVNCRSASSFTSIAVASYSPTVSANGTRVQTIVIGFNAQSIPNPMIVLDPGQTMLITGQATTTAVAICQAVYYEL